MLAAKKSLCSGETMSMKVTRSSRAKATAQLGVREGRSTMFHTCFDDICCHLQADHLLAAVRCQGSRILSLFYADDMDLPHCPLAESLSVGMRPSEFAGLHTISSLRQPCHHQHRQDEVLVFKGGTLGAPGRLLGRSFLRMLFHKDRHIQHAVHARYSKACAAVGAIDSCCFIRECFISVQLLMQLQKALLQPSAPICP